MNFRLCTFSAALLLGAGGLSWAQQSVPDAPSSGVVIRSETRQVLVDAVVTDKKGYVEGLKDKDFKVFEDGKEQTIKSFSYEADPASPMHAQKHYLVLVYDQCHMAFADQSRANDAALKFVSGNAGNNRPMSVMKFAGGMKMVQDFSEDTAKVNAAVKSLIGPGIGSDAASCTGRAIPEQFFDSIASLAAVLAPLPGRKILVVVSEGFVIPMNDPFAITRATVAINACNKANVAVYPIDIRGTSTLGIGMPGPPHAELDLRDLPAPVSGIQAFLKPVVYRPDSGMLFAPQRGGTGGGAPAGGATGGSSAGGASSSGRGASPSPSPSPSPAPSAGGRGGTTPAPAPAPNNGGRGAPAAGGAVNNNLNGRGPAPGNPSIPPLLRTINPQGNMGSAVDNQTVLYMLAQGTGGFVVADNDVVGGMEKISREQDQYYLLGYAPPDSEPGACHTIKVKVNKGEVRSRSGYCNIKPKDLLSGNPVEKTLEAKATAADAGNIPATLQIPFFFTSKNVARVEVAMDIAPSSIKFEKTKIKNKDTGKDENKLHAAINVLGIATTQQGAVAARFSDTVNLDFNTDGEVAQFKAAPLHYENQFDVASGSYNLKVVFNSAGDQFGKLEAPLVVEGYDPKDFALSGLALTKESHSVAQLGLGLEAMALDDRKPLIAEGMQFVPSGTLKFKKTEPGAIYFEIYDPLLEKTDPNFWVGIRLVVQDAKTGEVKSDTGGIRLKLPATPEGSVITRAYAVPVDKLAPGTYRAELAAADSTDKSARRTVEFEVQ